MLGELTKTEIESVLTSNIFGRIGCCTNQKVLVVPITYAYDGDSIIGHTEEGMKINMLRQNPECCVEVDVIENISNWKSVIAWGTFEELDGEEAKIALDKLVDKLSPYGPGETSQPSRMGPSSTQRTSTQGKNSIIYRIRLKEKTGRYEKY
jgi:nitroimidazol reductase NimA-like FMN-containing flavoprotein (pyridoxamine 5'-phosphate oxidase superfamily)